MAKDPPRPLPIVWYLNAADFRDRDCTATCYRLVTDAVARWEDDGTRTLNDLRAEIDDILYNKCP